MSPKKQKQTQTKNCSATVSNMMWHFPAKPCQYSVSGMRNRSSRYCFAIRCKRRSPIRQKRTEQHVTGIKSCGQVPRQSAHQVYPPVLHMCTTSTYPTAVGIVPFEFPREILDFHLKLSLLVLELPGKRERGHGNSEEWPMQNCHAKIHVIVIA